MKSTPKYDLLSSDMSTDNITAQLQRKRANRTQLHEAEGGLERLGMRDYIPR